jgi:hypothetical protein
MRRLCVLFVLALLFSVAQMVTAHGLYIERSVIDEPSVAATAVAESEPTISDAPRTTVPFAPYKSMSTAVTTPTTTLEATISLSTTSLLTTTDALATSQVFSATVIGYVREVGTEKPIPGAHVLVGGVSIKSRADGFFGPVAIPLDAAIDDVDASATANGYELWSFSGVTLRDTKKLDIHVQLRPKGTPTPARPKPRPMPSSVGTPPATIRLGLTGSADCVVPSLYEPIHVVEMPFTDYLRNVLPNEWVPSWPGASLDAGAVAVKQFAWYTAVVQRKWSSQGYNFDLLDSTCDQHYVGGSYGPSTDAALQRTWGLSLTRDGKLFPTYYRAWDYQCVRSKSADCMGQHGTEERARAGMTGIQILLDYYKNVAIEGLPRQNPVYLPMITTS